MSLNDFVIKSLVTKITRDMQIKWAAKYFGEHLL